MLQTCTHALLITSDMATLEIFPQKLRFWQCQHRGSVHHLFSMHSRDIFKTENSEGADSAISPA